MKKIISVLVALPAVLLMAAAVPAMAQTVSGSISSSVNNGVGSPSAVGSTLETHINNNGAVLVRGAKITAVSDSAISATQMWGSYNINWTIKTNASTELLRRYSAATSLSEFVVGDYVSFSGMLDPTQTQGTVNAKVVKDFSIQRDDSNFSGTVSSVNASTTSFVLATPSRGNVLIVVSPSTVITLGSASSTFSGISVGQRVTGTSGVWNNASNSLQATRVKIYVNEQLLNKRIFEGTLGSLTGTSLPASFTFTIGSKTYTVNLTNTTTLLSNHWNPIQLNQINPSDHVRIYGAVEMNNTSVIDAYIVRDTSVK